MASTWWFTLVALGLAGCDFAMCTLNVPLDYAKQVRKTKSELDRYIHRLENLSADVNVRKDFELGLFLEIAEHFVGFPQPQPVPPVDYPSSRRATQGGQGIPNPHDFLLFILRHYETDARTRTADILEILKKAQKKLEKVQNIVEYNCEKTVSDDSCALLVGEAFHYILNRCKNFYNTLKVQEAAHSLSHVVRNNEKRLSKHLDKEGAAYHFATDDKEAYHLGASFSVLRSATDENTHCD